MTCNVAFIGLGVMGYPMAGYISKAWLLIYIQPVSYTHLRAHETEADLVCRLLLEKNVKKKPNKITFKLKLLNIDKNYDL